MVPEGGDVNLSSYLDKILLDAGVPKESRVYLVDLARENLSKVPKNEISKKKELLKRNLYVLLIDLAAKQPLLFNKSENNFSLQVYKRPFEDFMSKDHLNFLNAHHVFEEVTVKDVKIILKTAGPIWPWTRGGNK